MFVDSTDKAVQLKVLKNALAPCSNKLKQAVEKKNLLARAKLPIAVSDLRKLVAATGFDTKAIDSIGEVEPVAARVSRAVQTPTARAAPICHIVSVGFKADVSYYLFRAIVCVSWFAKPTAGWRSAPA